MHQSRSPMGHTQSPGFSHTGISPTRSPGFQGQSSHSSTQLCLSPNANHPSMFPQGQRTQLSPSRAELAYARTVSPAPPGLGRQFLQIQTEQKTDEFVYRGPETTLQGGGDAARVGYSWDSNGNVAQWDHTRRGGATRDSEDTILKRIIETREELGRLQRANAAAERGKNSTIHPHCHAHEERALWAQTDGKVGAYSWGMFPPQGDDDEPFYPMYNQDETMTSRWNQRDQGLLKELEFTHLKLQHERARQKNLTKNSLFSSPTTTMAPGMTEVKTPEVDAQLAGWDLYTPTERRELVIPCNLLVSLGERYDYNDMLAHPASTRLERRFMAAAETSLAEAFRQPVQHTVVRYVEVLQGSLVRLHTEFEVSRHEVASVSASLQRTLATHRTIKLRHAAQVLKEGGRHSGAPQQSENFALTQATVACDVVSEKSWVGGVRVAQMIEGYGAPPPEALDPASRSKEIRLRLDASYSKFKQDAFVSALASELGIREECIDVRSVERGSVIVTLRIVGTYDAESIASHLLTRCGTRGDSIHSSIGKVLSSRYADEPSPRRRRREGSTTSSPRRRRRSDSESGTSKRGGSSRRRRRESSEGSERRRRRSDSDAGSERRRRRREEDSATGSERPRRRREEGGSTSPERSRRRRSDSTGSTTGGERRRRRREEESPERSERRRRRSEESSSPERRRRRREEEGASTGGGGGGGGGGSERRRRRREEGSTGGSERRRRRSDSDAGSERRRRRREEDSATGSERPRRRREEGGSTSPERSRRRRSDSTGSTTGGERRRRRREEESPERSERRRRRREEEAAGTPSRQEVTFDVPPPATDNKYSKSMSPPGVVGGGLAESSPGRSSSRRRRRTSESGGGGGSRRRRRSESGSPSSRRRRRDSEPATPSPAPDAYGSAAPPLGGPSGNPTKLPPQSGYATEI